MKKETDNSSILFTIFVLCIIILIFIYLGDYVHFFEIENEDYILKIVGKKEDQNGEESTDVFYYEIKDYKKAKGKWLELGCGTLISVGYDRNKHFLYGKSRYDEDFGIYKIQLHTNEQNTVSFTHGDEPEILQKLCSGYFVLNLKNGEYQSELSESEQEKILSDQGIKNNMLPVKKFLNSKGKYWFDYFISEAWMYRIKRDRLVK